MQLFYQPEISNGHHFLTQEESRHAVKVLRRLPGDQLNITDGLGSFYKATIVEANQKKCSFDIIEETKIKPSPVYRHIAIAPTKNIDRFEWFVEKATEFGIDRITPILCHNSERRIIKVDRIRKKALSAMKQSIKAFNPVIDELLNFQDCLKIGSDFKFIAHVDKLNPVQLKDEIQESGRHLILIGPEGDFSDNEIELAMNADFSKVSLGESRLRTETAGIAAAHLLNL
jgi:16S rRNA (uracil1498-N3)-methyltransferase